MANQRHKRRLELGNGVPCLLCEFVSVTGGTCCRVRLAACCDKYLFGKNLFAVIGNRTFNGAVFYYKLFGSVAKETSASTISTALSETGNTLPPLSVFSGTPMSSKSSIVSLGIKFENALYKNLPF